MHAALKGAATLFLWAAAVGAAILVRAEGALGQQIPTSKEAGYSSAVRQVTDETGRRVTVRVPPRRIVSLAPALTETLYALGVEDRLVGVTDYCDYPPEALKKSKIGGAVNPNLEQIVALQPDLVLAQALTLNRRETVDALERLGLAVYATSSHSVEGVLESTRHVGEVTGAGEAGERLVTQLRVRLAQLKQRLAGRPPRRVLFVVWHEPLISAGRDTFLADALRLAGAESVVETTQDWPRLSLEEIVRQQPEFLVFASAHAEGVERTIAELKDRPGWRDLEAVRQHHVAIVSDAINRPAPRLVDAIEQLARQLYPAAFEEKSETRNSSATADEMRSVATRAQL
jgi:iron complex transport system substrate-binding protein